MLASLYAAPCLSMRHCDKILLKLFTQYLLSAMDWCARMQAELGFTVRGTTDAALVLQQSIAVGAAANGLRWLWELKRQLHAPTEGAPARTASKEASPSSSDEDQCDSAITNMQCTTMQRCSIAFMICVDVLRPYIVLSLLILMGLLFA